ncbi:hypothetical protein C2I36_10115 [Rhodobacteraceae bacterium WD3A24]|nr:hypothetical protein C2I36_10115 [Rhodobacteraceae bacterium WD3A24]
MTISSQPDTRAAPPAPQAQGGGLPEVWRRRLLAMFLLTLLLPIQLEVASLRLSPYRFYLLLATIPFALALVTGRGGRVVPADWAMFLAVVWIFLSLVYHHGTANIPYAGITGVELFGGYLAGRLLIRTPQDYRRFIRYFLTALLLLAPFAAVELFTGRMIISELLSRVFTVGANEEGTRLGLSRVQAVFQHPILWGLFCSLAAANVFYVYKGRLARIALRMSLVIGMTFSSLSAGPLLSVLFQTLLVIWHFLTGGRWWLLISICIGLYILVDLASNRTPVTILISYATFNPVSAWYRINIWEYGTAEVMRHPLLGIGLNDWQRPAWMVHPTVDNFWLLMAMRYGLPALGLLIVGLVANLAAIVRARLDEAGRTLRNGYLIALAGVMLTLGTVHIWDALLAAIMFYIGAGAFFYTAPEPAAKVDQTGPPPASRRGAEDSPTRSPEAAGDPRRRPLPYTRAHPPQQYGKTSGR